MSHSEAFLRARKKKKRWALFVLALFLLVVGLCGLAGIVVVEAFGNVKVARDAAEAARDSVAAMDYTQAGEELERAQDATRAAKNNVDALKVLQPMPWVGVQIRSARELLDSTSELLAVVQLIADIGIGVEADLRSVGTIEDLTDIETFTSMSADERKELVLALNRAVPELEEAQARMRRQRRELEGMRSDGVFFGLRYVQEQLVNQVQMLDDTFTLVIPVLEVLPEVGGFTGPQHYLVFLQNTGELRPTGGFWGTYGVLRVEDGEVVDVVTDDIYAVDGPSEGFVTTTPPAPLQQYLGSDVWYLRDANWSPDVPDSIERGLAFYSAQTGVPAPSDRPVTAPRVNFDGVILLTPAVAETLLEKLGEVAIRDIIFEPESFFDVLEYEVEQGFIERGIPTADRKDVIGELVQVLLGRLQAADSDTLGALASAGVQLLENNDILLYDTNPDVQRIFAREGWTGDLRINASHDHAMVVDANLAALKTDTEIKRAYTYSVSKNIDGDLIATLQVNYDHLGGFDYRTTRYRTYTRVYVPQGSELIRVEGALKDDVLKNPGGLPGTVDVSQAYGATVFGAFTSVEPQANGRLAFVYKLPDRIKQMVEDGRYVFDYQRQPGVGDVALTLDLNFGEAISGANPSELSEYWFDERYTYSTRAVPFQSFVVEF